MSAILALIALEALPEPVAVTTHVHADMDGAASVYAVTRLLRLLGKDAFPMIFSASSSAKRLRSEEREYSSAAVLDTNKPERCPIRDVPTVVIDHHEPEPGFSGFKRIDPRMASTSEMVALILKAASAEPPRDVAEKLLLGIMYDTKNFLYASERSFEAAGYLRRFAREPAEFYEYEPDISARIASLKAAQRMKLYKRGNRVLAITNVSAHEAKAASDIIRLGADVAIVASDKRVVVRSREPILDLVRREFPQAGGHGKAFVIPSENPERDAETVKDIVLASRETSKETKKRILTSPL